MEVASLFVIGQPDVRFRALIALVHEIQNAQAHAAV